MSTTTQEISRDRWLSFFDAFSREHEGSAVNLEILSEEIGAQVEGSTLRFVGINADLKDGENRIAITLGGERDDHITHVVSAPIRVRLERSEMERGTFETLEVESAEGEKTLVRFLANAETPDEVC
jgi:hypothetical protein